MEHFLLLLILLVITSVFILFRRTSQELMVQIEEIGKVEKEEEIDNERKEYLSLFNSGLSR